MMRRAILVTMLAACTPEAPRVPETPAPVVEPIATTDAAYDDGKLHFYRSYFALEAVGKLARHYDLHYLDVEQSHASAVVVDGRVVITESDYGGLSSPPTAPPPVPAALDDEAALVEAKLRTTYPKAKRVHVTYSGEFREVVVSEMMVTTETTVLTKLAGWHARHVWRANADLTHVEGPAPGKWAFSGIGVIDVPTGSARIDATTPAELEQRALATARDVIAKKPVPSFDSILRAPHDPTPPDTFDGKVTLDLHVAGQSVPLVLHPRETLNGGNATAAAQISVRGVRISITATMTPFGPLTGPMRKSFAENGEQKESTITVHVDDGRGNTFDRGYPARGRVVVTEHAIALPMGLELPGTSSPSPEYELLHATMPAPVDRIDVSAVLYAQPR